MLALDFWNVCYVDFCWQLWPKHHGVHGFTAAFGDAETSSDREEFSRRSGPALATLRKLHHRWSSEDENNPMCCCLSIFDGINLLLCCLLEEIIKLVFRCICCCIVDHYDTAKLKIWLSLSDTGITASNVVYCYFYWKNWNRNVLFLYIFLESVCESATAAMVCSGQTLKGKVRVSSKRSGFGNVCLNNVATPSTCHQHCCHFLAMFYQFNFRCWSV